MLISLLNTLKSTNNLKREHRGVVVYNEDPLQLGRVKCTVEGIFEGAVESLPWIHKRGFDGGKSDNTHFFVPDVGSELVIKFPHEDVYFPEYVGFWDNTGTINALFSENYPKTWGFIDSKGNYLKINKETGETVYHHNSDTTHTWTVDGDLTSDIVRDETKNIGRDRFTTIEQNLTELIKNDVSTTIKRNLTELTEGSVDRTININLTELIKGSVDRTIDTNLSDHIKGNVVITVDGDLTWNVTGNVSMTSGGSHTVNNGGNHTVVAPRIDLN